MLEIKPLTYTKCDCCENVATIQINNGVENFYLCKSCVRKILYKAYIVLALNNFNKK